MSEAANSLPATRPPRLGPPPELIPELAEAVLYRLAAPIRIAWRRNWFYRRLLQGKLSDRILFHPSDLLPRRLEDADAFLRGRFRFAGASLDISEGSIFDKPPPSAAWAAALHSFAFLPPLAAAGGDPARTLATNLIAQWVKRYQTYSEPEWSPEVMAPRLINLFVHGRFVIPNSDVLWRSKLFVSLREQCRQLARIAESAPDGMPRFEAAAALALSGVCMDDSPRRLEQGVARLEAEIARQILPDGGFIDRSPDSLLHAFRLVVMVVEAFDATERRPPDTLLGARDRMAPMLRFFRHGDGALALFQDGCEGDRATISGLLSRDEAGGQPFAHAPHSQYQRLAAVRSYAIMDVGTIAHGAAANAAHASCLAFEFSAGTQRMVVNCGSSSQFDGLLRTTAAHSAVTLADTSMASALGPGWARKLIGPRLLGGPRSVSTERLDTSGSTTVTGRHDGYLRKFGILHQRQLTLSSDGSHLVGHDRLMPQANRRGDVPYAVRFHLHPDVRVTAAQGGDFLLKLPGGEGWRFRSNGETTIEDSVYLGNGQPRKTEQIVISGRVLREPAEIAWMFERIGVS